MYFQLICNNYIKLIIKDRWTKTYGEVNFSGTIYFFHDFNCGSETIGKFYEKNKWTLRRLAFWTAVQTVFCFVLKEPRLPIWSDWLAHSPNKIQYLNIGLKTFLNTENQIAIVRYSLVAGTGVAPGGAKERMHHQTFEAWSHNTFGSTKFF